jgi:hypothetical protein
MMRRISMWNITTVVSANITAGKPSVESRMYSDSNVLAVITVGRDHNYLNPGHYVVVDHALEGPETSLSVRITPADVNFDLESNCEPASHWKFVGILLSPREPVPCAVHVLSGKTAEESCIMSWRQQDASNS